MEILDRIDWASVNWLYVAVLSALVFFSTLIGALLSFKRAFRTAALSALLFAAGFVFWTYYPHGLPLPTSVTEKAPDTLRPNESRPNHDEEPISTFFNFLSCSMPQRTESLVASHVSAFGGKADMVFCGANVCF